MSITPAPELSPDADGIVGGGMDWYSDTLPNAKWRFCDGAALSRTEFSLLFSRIGTGYGTGDGSTTFNLPNRTGKFAVGFDSSDADFDNLGDTGGSKAGAVTATGFSDFQGSHTHTGATDGSGGVTIQGGTGASAAGAGHTHAVSTNPDGSHQHSTDVTGSAVTVPPFVVIRPIIKVM